MSAQLGPNQGDDKVVEMNDGPGRRLRLARQARGLEIGQVAAELHLPSDMITAMEREDYDALPGHVFVIGYLRNYARFLMLDPEPLLDAYRATRPEAANARLQPAPSGPRQVGSGHLPIKLISLAMVVALGWLAFSWWQSRYGGMDFTTSRSEQIAESPTHTWELNPTPDQNPPEPAPDEWKTTRPEASSVALAPQGLIEPPPEREPDARSRLSEAPEGESSSTETATEPEAVQQDLADDRSEVEPAALAQTQAQTQTSTPASTQEPSAGKEATEGADTTAQPADQVVMSFTGPCWVDIRDSEHKYKLFGEMGKGDRRVLEGTPPYSVILGNTAAVTVTVGGAPFDLQAFSRGNVARFTLDPTKLP